MNEAEQYTEAELIARVLNGEKMLYEAVVRRFNQHLYRVGRSYNYNHADTQDLMQDTFVDAYRNLAKFENRSSFKTWLTQIMLHNCYRRREKLSFKNELPKEVHEAAEQLVAADVYDTDKVVQNRELGLVLETALAEIPEDYRMVFSLREITGMSVAETAATLAITEANVKVRLNRAKTMLRHALEQSYSREELFAFNNIYCDAVARYVMAAIRLL